MRIKDLIDEAEALPVEERALVVDSLLRSLNPPESRIDKKWASVAQERLKEFRSGDVETVPGEEVFSKISPTGSDLAFCPCAGNGAKRKV